MTKDKTLVESVIRRIDDLMFFKLVFSFRDGTDYSVVVRAESYDLAREMVGKVDLPKDLPHTFQVIPVIQENPND